MTQYLMNKTIISSNFEFLNGFKDNSSLEKEIKHLEQFINDFKFDNSDFTILFMTL